MKDFKNVIDEEYPVRPDISIDFYQVNGDIQFLTNICNDSKISNPWDGYALAYLYAAKAVFNSIDNDSKLPNTIGYSFFYLNRHYLELRIKELIISGQEFFKDESNIPIFHDLSKLWSDCCEPILKQIIEYEIGYLPDKKREDFLVIKHFLEEIMKYDSNGDAFRYPCNKKGISHFTHPDVQTLNIKNLSFVMNWLSYYLEGKSVWINEIKKRRSDQRNQF